MVTGVLLGCGLLVASVVVAFLLGRSSATHVDWQTGTAHVGARQISVESDGWTYGVSGSVPMWFDARGSSHESGWPDCLAGDVRTISALRFAAAEVEVDGLGYRPIVAVDCRPAP